MRVNVKRTAAVITAAAFIFSEGATLNIVTALAGTVGTGAYTQAVKEWVV